MPSSHSSPDSVRIRLPNIDVDDQLIDNGLTETLQRNLRIIDNVKSLPSCAKVATGALMHTCSALEGTINEDESRLVKGFDLFIEEESTVYATRLAICELNDAGFDIPQQCASFIPTDHATKKRGIRGFWLNEGPTKPTSLFQFYEDMTKADLEKCRSALASTPQSWTSYSNSRQNANMLCRAMRSEIEKDQQIHLSKILAEVSASAAESLHEKIRMWEDAKPLFQQLSKSMPHFHEALAQNQQQLIMIRDLWEEILPHSQIVLHNIREQDAQLKRADATIHAILAGAGQLMSTMQSATVRQEKDAGALSAKTEAVSEALHFISAMVQDGLIQNIGFATQNFESLQGQVRQIHDELADWKENERKSREGDLKERQRIQDMTTRLATSINNTLPSVRKMEMVLLAAEARLEDLQSVLWAQITPVLRFVSFFCAAIAFWYQFAGLALLASIFASLASTIVLSLLDFTTLMATLTAFGQSCGEPRKIAMLVSIGFVVVVASFFAIRSKRWSNTNACDNECAAVEILRMPKTSPIREGRSVATVLSVNDPARMASKLSKPWRAPRAGLKKWEI